MAIRGVGSMDQVGSGPFGTYLSALVKGTDEDKAVMQSANDTVVLVTTGSNFFGTVRTIGAKDSLAGVQEEGWMELTYTGSAPTAANGNGYSFFVGGSTSGTVALADEDQIKTASVTVTTGQSTGASAADPDLVGGTKLGILSSTNQDQLVDDVTLNPDGSVTVTLAAGATGNNSFTVAILKAQSKWPVKCRVRSVDTTNSKVTLSPCN